MCNMVVSFSLALALFLIVLAWYLAKPLSEELSQPSEKESRELFSRHAQHFPQLRQSIASANACFVRRRASPEMKRIWREESRQIMQEYLTGLATDFARLESAARVVAPLRLHSSRREDWAVTWLAIRFRANYRVVWIGVLIGGRVSIHRIGHLTQLIGALGALVGEFGEDTF
jgi:hypothetical protein